VSTTDLQARPPRPPAELETRFVGRERELSDVVDRILGEPPLVTVTGPPGIGKTRLAREAMRRLREAGGDAVLFFEAGDLERPEQLAASVAERLGVPFEGGEKSGRTGFALDGLGAAVVVFDDVDHFSDAELTELFREWLGRAPELSILTTSRSRLGAEFEMCKSLDPLSVDAAVELFEVRARRVSSDFEVDEGNRGDVADLVEALDRLPLAIKLAAGRIRILSPSQMLDRLDQPFELLEGAEASSGGGIRSLRRAIEGSWKSLSEAERRGSRQCALFRGSFSTDAAERVVELREGGPPVLEIVEALVDQSLLRRSPEVGPDGEVRLEMLRSIREFALERLEESGELEETRRRHADYYRGESRIWRTNTAHSDFVDWVSAVETDSDNFRAALEWKLECGEPGAARIAATLADYLGDRRNHSGVREIVGAVLSRDDLEISPVARAKLLGARARAEHRRTGHREPGATWRSALEALDGENAPRLRCNLQIGLGVEEFFAGLFESARETVESTLELAEREEFELEEAALLSVLGRMECERENLQEAERSLRRGLRVVEPLETPLQESRLRINYGIVLARRGRPEERLEQVRRAVELVERDGVRLQGTTERANLACALAAAGDLEAADEEFERGARRLQRRGLRGAHANTLVDHGLVLVALGEPRRAARRFREAQRLADPEHREGAFPNLAGAHAGIGLAEAARGGSESAREEFERAEEIAVDVPTEVIERRFERFVSFVRTAAQVASARDADGGSGRAETLRDRFEAVAEQPRKSFEERIAFRILSEWAGAFFEGVGGGEEGDGAVSLTVGPEARWIELDGERLDFSRRGPLRRLVLALARERRAPEAESLSTYELLERGWPEQEVSPESGVNRVYTAVSRLRDLGFDEWLRTDDAGYYLAENLEVTFAET